MKRRTGHLSLDAFGQSKDMKSHWKERTAVCVGGLQLKGAKRRRRRRRQSSRLARFDRFKAPISAKAENRWRCPLTRKA
jgi:hypothetical protein